MTRIILVVFACCFFSATGVAAVPIVAVTPISAASEEFQVSQMPEMDSSSVRLDKKIQWINLKLNSLVFIGFVNPALEIRLHKNISFQLEPFGIFYPKNFLGTGYPLSIMLMYVEFRYYPKEVFRGFYAGLHGGCGVYRMNKNIVPKWITGYSKDPASIFTGQCLLVGGTIGYTFTLNEHWGVELSWGGGFQSSSYEAYTHRGEDKVVHTKWNRSAEWLPAYKGGVFVSYKF